MVMSIKQNIKRLGWRFSEASKRADLTFKINQNDLDALKGIADYFEQQQKQQFEANHLFAKMYIFTYMRVLEKEGSTVYDNTAKQRIGNILKKPMYQLIDDLTQSLNDSERYDWIENLGIEIKHPALRTETETTQVMTKINNALKSTNKVNLSPVWGSEFVSSAIMSEVNLMIDLYK